MIKRISILPGDPDRVPNPQNYDVFIDGVKQTHCIVADAEKGTALRYKKNAVGMLCRRRNNKFLTEEVQGVVAILPKVPK